MGDNATKSAIPRSFQFLILFLLVAAVVLRALFLEASFSNFGINADEALSFLQAQDIARGNLSLFFWTQPYQFPFEAYLLSVFGELLPWNTFGVRIVQVSICLFAVFGFAAIYRYLANWKTSWPGLLLLLFPSAYWLTRQVGLMTPQHAMMVTCAWVLPLIVGISKRSKTPQYWCLLGGLFAGMALSNHLLSLSIVFMASLSLCFAQCLRSAMKSSTFFVIGFLPGFAPYLYAKLFIPGAYEKVAETVPLSQAWRRIWDPVFVSQVPTGLGIDPWIFPDAAKKIGTFHSLVEPVAYGFAILLLVLTVVRAKGFFSRLSLNRWPSLELNDVFLGTTWIAIILLAATGMEPRTRYALQIVWCFPFLLSYAYAIAPRPGKLLLGFVTVAFVMLNISNSLALVSEWKKTEFSNRRALLPRLKPLYQYFEKHGITHCYAGWWLSYRLILDSQEKFICSPPFNDRFPRWKQPYYRELVDKAEETPYILGGYQHRLLRKEKFDPYFKRHRFLADWEQVGKFRVYTNFRHSDADASFVIPSEKLQARASHNEEDQDFLTDGDLKTVWSSEANQSPGMQLEIKLEEPVSVHALRLFARGKDFEQDPPRVNVEFVNERGEWQRAVSDVVGHPHLFKLDKTLPRYHYDALQLMLGFTPHKTQKLRVTIQKAGRQAPWQLAEIHIFSNKNFRK